MPSFRLTYHPGFRLRFHRTIFTLPDLSSLSPFSESNGNKQQPQTYHERKILPYVGPPSSSVCLLSSGWHYSYKPSQLYNLVADVESYPRFIPFCTGCRIIKRSPATSTFPERMEAELTIGFLSFKESYVSEVTCRPHQSVEVCTCESDSQHLNVSNMSSGCRSIIYAIIQDSQHGVAFSTGIAAVTAPESQTSAFGPFFSTRFAYDNEKNW